MSKEIQRRAGFLVLIITLVVASLVGQLGNLQLTSRSQDLLGRAESQRVRSLPVTAPRGLIYDRNGEPLASSRAAFTVSLVYPAYEDEQLLQRLSGLLNMPLAEIKKKVKAKREERRYYDPIRLKNDIGPDVHTHIVEQQLELPGVMIEAQPIREYHFGSMAAHVLGYVGEVDEEELARRRETALGPGDIVGKYGLESYYEEELRGRDGERLVEVDNLFRPLGVLSQTHPKPGNNLVLTIDRDLQELTERALDFNLWKIQTLNHPLDGKPWPNAKAGSVVVLDVRNGEVLAMVSRPTFDPNIFAAGISEQALRALNADPNAPFLNRSVGAYYPPGSTFKMLTSAAALAHGVVTPDDQVFCSGTFDKIEVGKKCWLESGHGWVNLTKALAVSCDVYFYEMGARLGISNLVETALDFGFAQVTGIDLDGEEEGIMPTTEYRAALERQNLSWTGGMTLSAAIGQSAVTATPLQLAQYTAAVANGGAKWRPHLVKEIRDARGVTVKRVNPELTGRVNLTPEQLMLLVRGMEAAHREGGTGAGVFADFPVPTGGKTGTAEFFGRDDYGIYVAFAPLHNPEIAVALLVEQAGHGSSLAPVAKAIFSKYFNVPLKPNDPARIPAEWPRRIDLLQKRLTPSFPGGRER